MILLIDKNHIFYHAPALKAFSSIDFEADIFFAQAELLPLLLGDIATDRFLLAFQSQGLSAVEEHLLYLLRAPLALWSASIAALPLSTLNAEGKLPELQFKWQPLQVRYQHRAKFLLKRAQQFIVDNELSFPDVPKSVLDTPLFPITPFQ